MVGRRSSICLWGLLLAFVVEPVTSWAISPRYTFYDKAKVLEVLGPNLLKLELVNRNKVVTIRLLGVGSPRNRDRIRGLDNGVVSYIQTKQVWETSRNFVRSSLKNKVIELWTRRWDQLDDKNRLLAYVIIPGNSKESVDLNGEIIRKGLGFVTRDYVHVTFVQYRQLEEEAREHRRGMWAGMAVGRMSSLSR